MPLLVATLLAMLITMLVGAERREGEESFTGSN